MGHRSHRRTAAPAAPGLLPAQLRNRGTKLLVQQCWYWGCDVRRPAGNLLLAYGFTRARPPQPADGSSMYWYQPAPDRQLVLWAFGVFSGIPSIGGLYLNRFAFAPLLLDATTLTPPLWRPAALPAMRPAAATDDCRRLAQLVTALLDDIIAYESWILATCGLQYRQACLDEWSRQKLALPAEQLQPAWQQLRADLVATLVETTPAEG
jgi:hypothetical protein